MRAALVIAVRILRQRLRDRSAIIFAVATPLGLALAFASVIPDFTPSFHTTIAVVDSDGGHLSQTLVDEVLGSLAKADIVSIEKVATVADARQLVDDGKAGAAVVIPAGFTDAVQAGRRADITILGGPSPTAREIARAAVTRFGNDIGTVELTLQTLGATGGAVDEAAVQAAQGVLQAPSPIAVADATATKRQAGLATFYGAAMAIMFVFFATQYGAFAILSERREGTLNRLLAAPVRPAAIILGASLAGFGLGLIAMSVLVVATTVLVHASWGPPLLVALLLVAAVVAAMGISSLVATLAKTVEQAGSLNAIVALCLAAVGGVFIPLSQTPETLARISQLTPHAWFLRAIDTMSVPGVGLSDIAPSILVLVAMGVVTGSIGLVRARGALAA